MAEYIERKATVDALNRLCERVCQYSKAQRNVMCGACPLGDAFTVIEDLIPAADVRPVVLCKDCKWCHAGYCEKYDDLIPFGCANKPWEDWFCADGVKREES